MKVIVSHEKGVKLREIADDEYLVFYRGQLCIREPNRKGVYTVFGEILTDRDDIIVQRIKSITLELE